MMIKPPPPISLYTGLYVRLAPAVTLTEEQFFEFCQINRRLKIERTPEGDILIMPPAGGETSNRNARLIFSFMNWANQNQLGFVFDSSGGFVLPDGSIASPDVAWVKKERLTTLTAEQKKRFIPLCPDFVLELRSPSDNLEPLKAKMKMYLSNGVQLAWLVNPEEQEIWVYRPGQEPQQLTQISQISGDPELPGLLVPLASIWNPEL